MTVRLHWLTPSALHRAEIAAATLMTIVAVALQWISTRSAGALWRDETAGVVVANLPTLSEMWNNMQYDSFPILWLLVARAVGTASGVMDDSAFRILGFVTGLGILAALWIHARAFRHSLPMASLALLALSPSVIVWGTSARAYGLAMLLAILTGAGIWRLVEKPGGWRFFAAAVAAIASVHTIFFNSVIVLAFCAGGVAVFAARREWRGAASVIAVGGIAALSLVPYSRMLEDAATWRVLARIPEYGLGLFWIKLYEVLRPGSSWSIVVWVSLFVVALYAAIRTLVAEPATELNKTSRDILTFTSVTMLVGVITYLLFLENLSYYPSPWYYLPLLGMCAVCIDSVSGALVRTVKARTLRLAGLIAVGTATVLAGVDAIRRPMTNAPEIANYLEREARTSDLIIVDPWFLGVSIHRFYRGSAPWLSVPPIGQFAFHRYDLVKENMRLDDQTLPVRGVLREVEKTLRSGGRVFVAGRLRRPDSAGITLLQAAPNEKGEWIEAQYRRHWGSLVGSFVQRHAVLVDSVRLPPDDAIPYEDFHLFEASGWNPD